jgi:hypothetical protein
MRLHVGPHLYRVAITEGPIFHEGEECLGLCVQQLREIQLSPACPPEDRLGMLIHELVHAHVFTDGEPKDLESWCDRIGSILRTLLRDLSSQGGEEALMRLRPGESPEANAAKIGLLRSRSCGRCSTMVAGGSVVCRPSRLPGVLDMALYCECCGHVQRWQEQAAASGLPSGIVVGDPTFERGDAARAFLRENPAAAPEYVAA